MSGHKLGVGGPIYKHSLCNPARSVRPVRLRDKVLSGLLIPSWQSWSSNNRSLPTDVYCYDTTAFDQEGFCVIASLSLKHCGLLSLRLMVFAMFHLYMLQFYQITFFKDHITDKSVGAQLAFEFTEIAIHTSGKKVLVPAVEMSRAWGGFSQSQNNQHKTLSMKSYCIFHSQLIKNHKNIYYILD